MQEDTMRKLERWKKDLETAWQDIPKHYRNDHTIRGTLQCHLYWALQLNGFKAVADYMPPRIQDRPIDLIAFDDEEKIVYAICIDPVVTLAAVKSLTSFEAVNRVIYTTGMLEKKVKESRFFLKPEIEHLHLQP